MSNVSPYILIKSLEGAIISALSGVDVYSLDARVARIVTALQKQIIETRLNVRDYELSETREEQLKYAKNSKRQLEAVRKDILIASEYNIFGPVDVAHLTAQLELVAEKLE
jgi:predicted Holliday junction resolvase-like endonuclease